MSEKKVTTNTHTVVQRLEDLRTEHMCLINSLDSPTTEKSDIILKNIKCLDVGLDEAQLMMEFTLHLQNVEIEKQQLNTQVKQLSEENRGLRDELIVTRDKLKLFERMVGIVENNEINMKTASVQDENKLPILFDDPAIESNDLLQNCEYDSDSTLTPRGQNQSVRTDGDEYEALSRFRKLENLAMNYASEGKYEVALLLSEQAVDNLKKTTVGRFHPNLERMVSIVSVVYGIQKKYKDAIQLLHETIRHSTQPRTLEG